MNKRDALAKAMAEAITWSCIDIQNGDVEGTWLMTLTELAQEMLDTFHEKVCVKETKCCCGKADE